MDVDFKKFFYLAFSMEMKKMEMKMDTENRNKSLKLILWSFSMPHYTFNLNDE